MMQWVKVSMLTYCIAAGWSYRVTQWNKLPQHWRHVIGRSIIT